MSTSVIIPTSWKLPESIRIRLGSSTYGRQRAIVEEGQILLVLHKPPGTDERARVGTLFWRNAAGEWQWSHGGGGPNTLRRHINGFAELEAGLSERAEKATSSKALFEVLDDAVPLHRTARHMHQAMQTAREALKGDTLMIEMRDLAYDVERSFELLVEEVRHAIQRRTAEEQEAQAKRADAALEASHRLNVMAATFFPLTAIASLFGMNLKHGLDEDSPPVFWAVLGVGVALGWVMRRWVLGKSEE